MWSQHLVAPFRFEMAEVEAPDPRGLSRGQVLIRTLAGGVCGSDMPYFAGVASPTMPTAGINWPPDPGFPMHEVVGTVVASRHAEIDEGDRVVGWAADCNALSELVVCQGSELHTYDPSLPPEIAVSLQSLACVLYAVEQLTDVTDATAAIIGQGPIGLLFAHVLRSAGAGRIVGVDSADRGDVGKPFGVDESLHTSSDRWALSLSHDRPNIVIEAVGHQAGTLNDATEAVTPGGQIYYFGIPDDASYSFNIDRFLRKGLTLRAGITRDRRRMLATADHYLRDHPALAEHFVTDVVPVADATNAYLRARTPGDKQVKIVVSMK